MDLDKLALDSAWDTFTDIAGLATHRQALAFAIRDYLLNMANGQPEPEPVRELRAGDVVRCVEDYPEGPLVEGALYAIVTRRQAWVDLLGHEGGYHISRFVLEPSTEATYIQEALWL